MLFKFFFGLTCSYDRGNASCNKSIAGAIPLKSDTKKSFRVRLLSICRYEAIHAYGIANLVTKGRPGETVTNYCRFRACLPRLSSFFLPVAVFPFTQRWSCSRKRCVPKKRTIENVAAARGNCRRSRC